MKNKNEKLSKKEIEIGLNEIIKVLGSIKAVITIINNDLKNEK